jgi:nucleoid-associated protein YgaU
MITTTALARLRAFPLLVATGTTQWLLWQAGSSAAVRAAATVRDPVRRVDPLLTGQLVADLAMTLVLVAGTWLVVVTLVTVVDQIVPGPSRWRCPTLAPKAWRRLVITLLGTGVLAVPVLVTGTTNAMDSRDAESAREDTPFGALHGLRYLDRPTTARPAPSDPTPPARPAVVVRPGDSLWSLAAAADPGATTAQVARRWPRWYAANRAVIGPDPDLLIPGTVLITPRHP